LLLEAGPLAPPDEVYAPESFPASLLGSAVDWSFLTTLQCGTAGTMHMWSRGKVIGGSSAIKAMAHVRGHKANYDSWAPRGGSGWSYEEVLPYFKRCETAPGRECAYRGTDGPLVVAPPRDLSPDALAFQQESPKPGIRPRPISMDASSPGLLSMT